jgi:hypothetical protein
MGQVRGGNHEQAGNMPRGTPGGAPVFCSLRQKSRRGSQLATPDAIPAAVCPVKAGRVLARELLDKPDQ